MKRKRPQDGAKTKDKKRQTKPSKYERRYQTIAANALLAQAAGEDGSAPASILVPSATKVTEAAAVKETPKKPREAKESRHNKPVTKIIPTASLSLLFQSSVPKLSLTRFGTMWKRALECLKTNQIPLEHFQVIHSEASAPSAAQEIESLMTQTQMIYSLTKRDRQEEPVGPTQTKCLLFRDTMFRLPGFLQTQTWKRHGHTEESIKVSLNCYQPTQLSHPIMTVQKTLSNISAVKPSCSSMYPAQYPDFASQRDLIHGGKNNSVSRIIRSLGPEFREIKPPILVNPYDSHIPRLPVHLLSQQDYDTFIQMTPNPNGCLLEVPWAYKTKFRWKDICIVPLLFEPETGFLLMHRVLPVDTYLLIYGEANCVTTEAPRVWVGDIEHCLLDEAFYLITDQRLIHVLEKVLK